MKSKTRKLLSSVLAFALSICMMLPMMSGVTLVAEAADSQVLNASEMATGEITETTSYGYFTVAATGEKKVTVDENKKVGDNGLEFTQRLKLGGSGSAEYRNVSFTTSGAATITVYAMSGSSSENRPLLLMAADGATEIARADALGVVEESIIPAITYEVSEAGTYYIWSAASGINIYYIEVTEKAAASAGAAKTLSLNVSDLDTATITEFTSYGDFTVAATADKTVVIDENKKIGDNGVEFTKRMKLGGAGSTELRSVSFTTSGAATVTVYAMSGSSGENRPLLLMTADGTEVGRAETLGVVEESIIPAITYEVPAAGTYYIWSEKSGINIYSIEVKEAGGATAAPSVLNASELDAATYTDVTAVGDFTVAASADKTVVIDENSKTGDNGMEFTKRLKLGGAGSAELRSVSFTTSGAATVNVYAMSGSSGENRPLLLVSADGVEVGRAETLGVVEEGIIPVITYEVTAAGTYYIWSEKSGINIYYIEVVPEGAAAAEPTRAAWSTVAAPVLGTPVVENGTIKVPYTMVIGPSTDGCDRLYIYMYDAAGNEIEKVTQAAQTLTGGTAEFNPSASGDYTFKCEAIRTDEEAVLTGNSAEVKGYMLPLSTPVVSSATSQGSGKVEVVWLAVDEAESYTVSYHAEGSDAITVAGTTAETTFVVEGLTVGTRYVFEVVANRGTDASAAGSIEANATEAAQRVWSFATYGSSTNTTDNWYEGNANDGSVTIASLNGKGKIVPGSTDGIAFYYTTIDPEKENFVLEATITVDEWTFSNGQDGFGMMVADAVGTHGDSSAFWNNYFSAVVSKVEYWYDYEKQEVVTGDTGTANKISMKLGVGTQEKRGVTAANLADGSLQEKVAELFITNTEPLEYSQRYAAGTYNIVGNYTNATKPTGTVGEKALVTEFRFRIERNNTGYYVSYITYDKNGNENVETRRFYDLERNALTQIDPDNIYVGFYAARNAKITVTDISLTTSDPATDAPAEGREITYIAPELAVNSAETTGNDDYTLNIYTNANGTIDVKGNNGEVYAEGVRATAETYTYITVEDLPTGLTNFRIYFTPDADFKFSEYEMLSTYETTEIQWAVSKKVFDMNVIYVAPNVDPSYTGKGTKDNPTDLNNAMEYAKEGQIIVLTEGTYKEFLSTITVGRGNDGTAENPIILMADPEAATRPVLDFGGKGSGMTIAGDYWILDGFDVTNSKDGSKGITISGSNCIIQNVNTYNNGNSGINIGRWKGQDLWNEWPANNLVLNCSSWDNADVGYEDADGFACKLTIAEGNVFDGCIAHNNADDGWDLFGKIETGSIGSVVIKNSLAYGNGYLSDGTNAGNGNGFKMGGDSLAGNHKLYNSFAFDNKAKGLDSNSGPNIELYNCTSFNNGGANVALYTNDNANTAYVVNGLVSFRTLAMDVKETFKLKGTQIESNVYGVNNYFYDTTAQTGVNTEGAKVDASWFVSTDTSIEITRNADGTINMNGLLQLTDAAAAGSGAVMGGTPNVDYAPVLAAAQAKDAEKAAAEVTPEPTEAPEATVAPTETPSTDEPTAVPTEAPANVDVDNNNGSGAGTVGIIVVVVIAVVAIAAVAVAAVLAKKKKANK